ncbi:hypothetical protein IJG14_07915 [bacterium]|nr:hypothetical protein [bacterium]
MEVNNSINNKKISSINKTEKKPQEISISTDTAKSQNTTNNIPADLLKAYVGINNSSPIQTTNEQVQQKTKEPEYTEMTAFEYLNTLPNVKQTFQKELKAVADVMEKMDVESSNVEMMVNLVAEGKLWRGVLRYFCENGRMSKPMEDDVVKLYEAYGYGEKPIDRQVPTYSDKNFAVSFVNVGDTFEIEGEKNIYVKNKDGEAHQLKVSKELFGELFPLAERFSCVQGAAGDCYLLSTLNSIMENPSQRYLIYDMFEETDDSVNVKMPNGEAVYTVPKDNLRQGIDKWQHMQGATGMILAEHVYGEELKLQYEHEFYNFMNSEIERLEAEDPDNIEKIEGYKKRLADFDKQNSDGTTLPVLIRFENPDAQGKLTFQTDEHGIMFKDLKSANKELHRKLSTQADFYRGSVGGDLDVVMKSFGYDDIQEYKTGNSEQEQAIKDILFSNDANNNYIFTAGSLSDGSLTEQPIAKEYSIYGEHAYKIAPFNDKNGTVKFYVENPWNATQNSIMDYDKLKEFFEVICAVKVK